MCVCVCVACVSRSVATSPLYSRGVDVDAWWWVLLTDLKEWCGATQDSKIFGIVVPHSTAKNPLRTLHSRVVST